MRRRYDGRIGTGRKKFACNLSRSSPQRLEKENRYGCGQKNKHGRLRNARCGRVSITAPCVSVIATVAPTIPVPRVPINATVVVMMLVPSPSLAVIIVRIPKPVHVVLVEAKGPGLEEAGMTVHRSTVGIGEVKVVKIGIGAIGKAVHAVRSNRGRKYQGANSKQANNPKESSHFDFPCSGRCGDEAGRPQLRHEQTRNCAIGRPGDSGLMY